MVPGANQNSLDDLDEPLGMLDVSITAVAAGGSSKFLPEAYIDLFDPGNII